MPPKASTSPRLSRDNIHERRLPVPLDEAGRLLETLAGPGDRIWTTGLLAPMVLDDGLNPGSGGGHGPVRYRVVEHEPHRRVRFAFAPRSGIAGWHELTVHPDPSGDGTSRIRHVLHARPQGVMRAAWPMVIAAHDAGLEDVFDNLERSLGAAAHPQQRTSRLVRALGPRIRSRRVTPATAYGEPLRDDTLTRVDFADAWSTPLLPDDPVDPQRWADRIFDLGGWVRAAMRLRDAVTRPLGLAGGADQGLFPLLTATERAVVLGVDNAHLRFRVEVACADGLVTVTTAVMLLNALGHAYWLPVRVAHPVVVRACLARVPLPATGPTTPAPR